MKKILIILSFAFIILLTSCSFLVSPSENQECKHDWQVSNRVEATCEKEGKITYTCSKCEETKEEKINAKGHNWDNPSYAWAEDYSTCKVTLTCKNDASHKVERDAVITSSSTATCGMAGVRTYVATLEIDGKTFTDNKTKDEEALVHDFGALILYKAPTCEVDGMLAHYVCSNCGAYLDDNHAPTTEEALKVAAIGHNYGEPAWTWVDGEATLKFVCSNNASHIQVIDANVTSETTATCTAPGITTYTGKATFEGNEYQDTKVADQAALGHCYGIGVIIKAATTTEAGKKQSTCLRCGDVKVEDIPALVSANPDDYASTNGRTFLSTLSNGANMVKFYDELAKLCKDFHTGEIADAEDTGSAYKIGQANATGITVEEGVAVYTLFTCDHPLYYWTGSTYLTYTSGDTFTGLGVMCDSAYATWTERKKANDSIFEKIAEFSNYVNGEASNYLIALGLHDVIIDNMEYAYKADGRTPEDASWAHSIVGGMLKGRGVCESYSKIFSLLLNYLDVPNYYVVGDAYSYPDATGANAIYATYSEGHAWNMVQADDSKWYLCDLTWDDHINTYGYKYNYFMCTENEITTNFEAGFSYAAGYEARRDGEGNLIGFTFAESHVADTPSGSYTDGFLYQLPAVSTAKYNGANALRTTFVEDGITYAVIGYKRVQVINVAKTGAVEISEYVTHDTKDYNVIAFGTMKSGVITNESVLADGVTSLSLPKSMRFIITWGAKDGHGALDCETLSAITVDSANPYYYSDGSCLYNKAKTELYKYAPDADANTYHVLSSVTKITSYAFCNVASIKDVYVPASVVIIESQAFVFCNNSLKIHIAQTGPLPGFGTQFASVNSTRSDYHTVLYEG